MQLDSLKKVAPPEIHPSIDEFGRVLLEIYSETYVRTLPHHLLVFLFAQFTNDKNNLKNTNTNALTLYAKCLQPATVKH